MKEPVDPQYCIVKYYHYEVTHKPLECKNCVMDCEYKNESIIGGGNNDKSTN